MVFLVKKDLPTTRRTQLYYRSASELDPKRAIPWPKRNTNDGSLHTHVRIKGLRDSNQIDLYAVHTVEEERHTRRWDFNGTSLDVDGQKKKKTTEW